MSIHGPSISTCETGNECVCKLAEYIYKVLWKQQSLGAAVLGETDMTSATSGALKRASSESCR